MTLWICKNVRSSVANLLSLRIFGASNRAVVQLGRTLEWGAYPDDFLKLSRLDLTRSTLGKAANRHDLTCTQIMPKIFHEWIKQWIKLERLRDFQMGRSESAELLLMYLGRCLDTSDTQKQAWRVYRTARTTFPGTAKDLTMRSSQHTVCEK